MLRRGTSIISSLLHPKGKKEFEEFATLVEPSPKSEEVIHGGRGSLLGGADRVGSDNGPTEEVAEKVPPISGAQNNELILDSFNSDLLRLINLTQSTLTRAMRPQSGGMTDGVLGPLQKGLEIAERIEQRGRSLLLETSLTAEQRPRVLCAAQNAQDQSVALRTARYAWQACIILTSIPGGNGTFARVKRLVAAVTELNGKVSSVLEATDGTEREAAAEVAGHYRTVMTEQSEILTILRHDIAAPPLARRMGRAAVMSLVVAAESMARVAARLAYPESVSARPAGGQQPGLNDGVLRPL